MARLGHHSYVQSAVPPAQLFRYFAVANARIAVLTNGDEYQLFTDLDAPDKMDEKPFLVVQISDLDAAWVSELRKLTKDAFDLESMIGAAEELKYVGELKRACGRSVCRKRSAQRRN